MQGDPILRNARADDIPAIEALLATENLPPQGIVDTLETFWVLDEMGTIVGSIGLELYDDVGFIRSVIVETSRRKKGLGERLVQVALAEALDRDLRRVFLFTMKAGHFFASFGFQECELEDFDPAVRASFQYKAMTARPDLRARAKPMRLEMGRPLNASV